MYALLKHRNCVIHKGALVPGPGGARLILFRGGGFVLAD